MSAVALATTKSLELIGQAALILDSAGLVIAAGEGQLTAFMLHSIRPPGLDTLYR